MAAILVPKYLEGAQLTWRAKNKSFNLRVNTICSFLLLFLFLFCFVLFFQGNVPLEKQNKKSQNSPCIDLDN